MDFFKEILNEAHGWVKQFQFCSLGEPFLNKNLPEMLSLAASHKIGTLIVTNGMLITPEIADHLIRSTSIEYLTFSIDGAKAKTCETLRRGLSFTKLLDAVQLVTTTKKRLKKKRPELRVNFVAMKSNIEELPDLVHLASRIGIQGINVNYATIEGDIELSNSLYNDPKLQKEVFAIARIYGRECDIDLRLPADIENTHITTKCRFPWDSMIIDTDGSVHLCYFAWENTIGNIRTDGGICAVWNNGIYRAVRKTIDSPEPFYRYCTSCGRRNGYKGKMAHLGKNDRNADLFSFRTIDNENCPTDQQKIIKGER